MTRKYVQLKTIMKKLLLNLIVISLLTSCSEKISTNPNEIYQLWSGNKPTDEIKVINGKYWESAHWSREYILFLELETDKKFWTEFKNQNNLIIDTTKFDYSISEKPNWFNPSKKSIKYKINDNFDQGSRYYQDSTSNKIFIYEIQL